ncbi:MAG TPA: nuclear transport factor 2 family protein [Terriglobales bacterium]|nr:nuclear transport factor 2 family protein [Terriglobales bacterium]
MLRLLTLFCCTIILASALPLHAATSEEQAVLAPLQSLFDAMAKHDKSAARDTLLPGGIVTLKRKDQIIQMHFDTFVEHLGGTDKIEERIHDPQIHIDNDIAVIWVPYEFLEDGKVTHCGTDIAHLVLHKGRWLIAGIADNAHDTCK